MRYENVRTIVAVAHKLILNNGERIILLFDGESD